MNRMSLRPILAPLVGAAICFAVSQRPGAAVNEMPLAHFSAKAMSVSENTYAGRIDILIERWSTDAERENLLGSFIKKGPNELLPVLQQLRRRAGVLLMPGVQATGTRARTRRARNLLFAREAETPAGRQVIVAAGQHLGIGEYARWGASSEDEFTLIDIRVGPDGTGVGKLAPATKVAYNKATKTIEVDNFGKEPVRLSEVRSEKAANR